MADVKPLKQTAGVIGEIASGDTLAIANGGTGSPDTGFAPIRSLAWCTASGTDTILLTPTPAITAYAAGQEFLFVQTGGNNASPSPTINVSSQGAITPSMGGTTLPAGGLINGDAYRVLMTSASTAILSPYDAVSSHGDIINGTLGVTGVSTFSGAIVAANDLKLTQTVNSTITGTNADLATHPTPFIRVTNASLVSIGSINNTAVTSGHAILLENDTGNTITIVNNYGSPPGGSCSVITGLGKDLTLLNEQVVWMLYDSPNWQVVGQLANAANLTGVIPIANGGTNATSASAARANLGITGDVNINQPTHGFLIGEVVYITTSLNVWAKAQSNASATAANGIVSAVTDADNFTYRTLGALTLPATTDWDAQTGDTGGLTIGEYYWLDNAIAGNLTKNPTGLYVQSLGKATSTTTLEIKIEQMQAYSGDVSVTLTTHGFVPGDLIYSTGTTPSWALAIANDPIKMANAVVTAVADANHFSYKESGTTTLSTTQWDACVTGQSGGLTAGNYYWLDQITPGNMTLTQPTTGYVQCVGKAINTVSMETEIDIAVSYAVNAPAWYMSPVQTLSTDTMTIGENMQFITVGDFYNQGAIVNNGRMAIL